jgi:hypothetical protein
VDDVGAAAPGEPAPRRAPRRWRRRNSVPARAERAWIHPSELPNFDAIPAYDPAHRDRPHSVLVLTMGAVVLALGALTLSLRSTSSPATSSLRNIAPSAADLPSYSRTAARSTIELVITEHGHLSAAAAMVIAPGNLAVTTDPIPSGASVTGSSQLSERFGVTRVSHDSALGFTVVRLAQRLPVTPTGVLPDSSTVLAISPVFTPRAAWPAFAWAITTLGDPVIEQRDGIVSYLATPSAPNLDGFVDALAVNDEGDVVAVLSATGQWYSARYVTRVAQVVTENGGCHGRLGITGDTAQGGGVQVQEVLAGPSRGVLRSGDVLTNLGGVRLDSMDTLLEYLYASPAHHRVRIRLLRGGRPRSAVVTLGCQP